MARPSSSKATTCLPIVPRVMSKPGRALPVVKNWISWHFFHNAGQLAKTVWKQHRFSPVIFSSHLYFCRALLIRLLPLDFGLVADENSRTVHFALKPLASNPGALTRDLGIPSV